MRRYVEAGLADQRAGTALPFELLQVRRVDLKTSALNARSRAAILRLGATEEGTLRKHMINEDGSARDSVYFSITDDEWPRVRARLEEQLRR
ncbi:MAG TPA: GNAT family protein [Gemmatimonadaceae bacterium]|nr:GNAT family protein [Gemmatimonadaceae bacterium]